MPRDGAIAALTPGQFEPLAAELMRGARLSWDRMQDRRSDLALGHDSYLKLWALDRLTIDGDYILLDEAQDLNAIALGLMKHQTAQLVVVGDAWQQIYEWRGATNGMTALHTEADARLSMSFRFGPEIASNANGILSILGETVPLVGNSNVPGRIGEIALPSIIIARTNARLIDELVRALEDGRRPYIVGGVKAMLSFIDAAEKLMAGGPVEYPPELAVALRRRDPDQTRT